jgi:hypothetical protein
MTGAAHRPRPLRRGDRQAQPDHHRVGRLLPDRACPNVPSARWMPTCGDWPGSGPSSPTRPSRGAGSSPGTSACSIRPGRTSGCSAAGRPVSTSASSPGRKSSGTGWSPGGRPRTTPPSPGTGTSGDAAPGSRWTRPPGTCCAASAAGARSAGDCCCTPTTSPQGPDEWQQWHTATRKAIRKHAIASVMDLDTPDERAAHHLIHIHCRHRISSGTNPSSPARQRAPRACFSRAARKAGTAGY